MRVRRKNNWDLVLKLSYEEVRSNGLLYVIREEPFQVEYKTSVLVGIMRRDLHRAILILDAAAPALRIRRFFKATLKNDLTQVVMYHRNLSVVLHEVTLITNNVNHRIRGSVNMSFYSYSGNLRLITGKKNVRSILAEGKMWSNPIYEVERVDPLPLDGMRSIAQVLWDEHVRVSEILAHTQRALAAVTGSQGCGAPAPTGPRSCRSQP